MTNRLAEAQSLYLRKHAENPIDWWSWCDEALDRARTDDKPIFLSIGYSSCHWCTVMEGEAFSDPSIAEYMNANFLPIKVDREERPDLDSIYMQALQMIAGQGGWPLNIFLTPGDLVPFYGGTYFPVTPRYGQPGFLQVLQAIRRYYDTQKNKIQAIKDEMMDALHQSVSLPGREGDTETAKLQQDNLLQRGLEVSSGIVSGGTPGPSFPMIPYADVALRASRFDFDSRYNSNESATQRGLVLALGGIYDHVGGGFHRYTVDPTWTVPHFEKMLYDNGQILEYLSNLWSAGVQEPAFDRAIAGTVNWLKREMSAPQGYFYAAQDADSFTTPEDKEPEEGAFYVWRYDELEQLLDAEEFAELKQQFFVGEDGNFEGKIVLQRRKPGQLSQKLEAALDKLFAVRYGASPDEVKTFDPARNNDEAKTKDWSGRIPPVTDTKAIVAWNSLMISGLARAYGVFDRSDYLDLAVGAANFILENQQVGDRFYRLNYEGQASVLAQSEDYALFIKALLDLHQVTLTQDSPTPWLEKAKTLQAEFDEYLWSDEMGGYYNTAKDASDDLLIRERSYIDNATPSANGVAIANLVRLALLTEDLSYLDRAEQGLKGFASVMEQSPQACPTLFGALDWYRYPTLVRASETEIEQIVQQYFPTAAYKIAGDLPDGAVAMVCQGLSCKEPAKSREQAIAQLQQSVTGG